MKPFAGYAATTAPNARLHMRSGTDYRAIAAQYHVRIANILPKYEHNSLLIYAFIITIIYAIFLMLTKRNAEEINVLMAKMA